MGSERSRLQAEALTEMALAIASGGPPAAVLQRLLDLVVGLTGASRGAMISIDPDSRVREMILSGTSAGPRPGPSPPTDGVVMALLDDTRTTRLEGLQLPSSSLGFPAHQPAVSSLVGGQVRALDRCYGCIYLADKRDGPRFTAEDERVVEALAAQAGMALAYRRLASEARLHAAWRGALMRVASAVRMGGTVSGFLSEVAGAGRVLADADLALVIGPGASNRHPTVLAADGEGAARLLGAPARARLPGMGPAITVSLRRDVPASRSLRVMRTRRRPEFDPPVSGLVESFWEQAAIMLDHVLLRSAGTGAVTPDQRHQTLQLHDDVVQTLFGIGMEIQAAALQMGDGDLAPRLEEAASQLDWLIDRLRHHDEAGPHERTLTGFS